ncbi:hypothetical protein ACFP7A_06825 [Sporolactobacillus kofuensis]|uniref:Uncharacterized protein n=1 Tax=Sporolactobacillus kofuensis TaxID=269672 RepID=A0ABW1WFC8_9BACL|nr:hypothetical protein [Sporolactobacillus kofuensis]MCO7175380.1 hypothetical protein [Sporolactobacillus kofuensis]
MLSDFGESSDKQADPVRGDLKEQCSSEQVTNEKQRDILTNLLSWKGNVNLDGTAGTDRALIAKQLVHSMMHKRDGDCEQISHVDQSQIDEEYYREHYGSANGRRSNQKSNEKENECNKFYDTVRKNPVHNYSDERIDDYWTTDLDDIEIESALEENGLEDVQDSDEAISEYEREIMDTD